MKKDLDAVFIYAIMLAGNTAKALNKGINVFCEKPPALNLKDLDIVFEPLNSSGKVLKYGFNHRYHYSVIEAKKLSDSGIMGKLFVDEGAYGKSW